MKLSELSASGQTDAAIAWGVEVDDDILDPPAGLKAIGLLWAGREDGGISDTLIDAIISFGLAGVDVILEIRPEDEIVPEEILRLAGNAGFSVSAIPPETDDPEAQGAWERQCAGLARALLTTPGLTAPVYPVTGYLSYLVMEKFAGATSATPNDTYTLERFVDAVSEDRSNVAKSAMRSAMTDMLGGEEGLTAYLAAILREAHIQTSGQIEQTLRDLRDQMPAHDETA